MVKPEKIIFKKITFSFIMRKVILMYEYKVIHSKRKTVAVEITESCQLIVRAPLRFSDRAIENFVSRNEKWIDEHMQKSRKRMENRPSITPENVDQLKRLANELIPKKVEYYSKLMNLKPNGVKITCAKKRFGSCSATNHLCFSCVLALYPEEAVDYVVVHELAHIPHKNHGKDFYRLIEKYLPDYKERIKILKGDI